MASLLVQNGKMNGRRVNLGPGSYLLGRDVQCQICIGSPRVSRLHCEFTVGLTDIAVRDVGSRNGTMVNGLVIDDSVTLKVGDIVDVGPVQLELITTSAPPRVGAAPHVADEALVADSIVDWLQEEKQDFATTVSIPSLKPQNTPLRKFNDVAEEGADIIQRHFESLEQNEPSVPSADDTVDGVD
jgi:pSer/pThr/pTyr-binding forkhead associated (FHA) protein